MKQITAMILGIAALAAANHAAAITIEISRIEHEVRAFVGKANGNSNIFTETPSWSDHTFALPAADEIARQLFEGDANALSLHKDPLDLLSPQAAYWNSSYSTYGGISNDQPFTFAKAPLLPIPDSSSTALLLGAVLIGLLVLRRMTRR